MSRFARQCSAAQAALDHAYPYDDTAEEAEEQRAEGIAELFASYQRNDAKRAEAEEWTAGTFDSSHYAEVTLALHEFHHMSADKFDGSDLQTRLYRLARVEAMALDEHLRAMAEAEYDRSKAA